VKDLDILTANDGHAGFSVGQKSTSSPLLLHEAQFGTDLGVMERFQSAAAALVRLVDAQVPQMEADARRTARTFRSRSLAEWSRMRSPMFAPPL
ncbi:MAG TPA: hypothetical protein VD840_18600, partial [Sinorhizobium sp.]|nr:hypothetical protein [Sinorhizobium sp.]